jgi:nitrogen fixation NifU-like protein
MNSNLNQRERIDQCNGYGRLTRICGDAVEFFLNCGDGKIISATFLINGCRNTYICAYTVSRMIKSKSLKDAWKITPKDVMKQLPNLPSEEYHCAELAVNTLYRALSNYQTNQRDSWKKLYQKKSNRF